MTVSEWRERQASQQQRSQAAKSEKEGQPKKEQPKKKKKAQKAVLEQAKTKSPLKAKLKSQARATKLKMQAKAKEALWEGVDQEGAHLSVRFRTDRTPLVSLYRRRKQILQISIRKNGEKKAVGIMKEIAIRFARGEIMLENVKAERDAMEESWKGAASPKRRLTRKTSVPMTGPENLEATAGRTGGSQATRSRTGSSTCTARSS